MADGILTERQLEQQTILSTAYMNFGATASMIIDAATAMDGSGKASFDWNGNTEIPCSCGPAEHGKELTLDGGWEIRRKVKVTVRFEKLPDASDPPAPNDTLVLRLSEDGVEVKYKILKTKNSEDSALEMECVDTNHD